MSGIRFSPFSTAQQPQQQVPIMKVPPKPKQYTVKNLSGSDTDISTSNENLSKEERYVIKHTARVEPQGQENLQGGKITPTNDPNQNRLIDVNQQLRFSNTSSDSTRYATPTSQRSVSEARNASTQQQHDSNRSSLIASTNSNRNSLKETNSNRSSMDVSQSSYNTLIIHNDDFHDYSSPPPYGNAKKDRPRSYGERQDVEEYLSQSHVLKHLAKEVKLPRVENTRDSGVSDEPPRYPDEAGANKLKSKSQPDLNNLSEGEDEDVEVLIKENLHLKEQLNIMYHKLAKTTKLQQEIANIHREYEALVTSCDRREKLELTARNRLQNEIIRLQEVARVLREQNEALQNQLLVLPDGSRNQQETLMQLAAKNHELSEANKRQFIEIQAQNVTLEEQRAHIHFLDNALKRLQDENRQKQMYVERCAQLQHLLNLQNQDRKLMLDPFDKPDVNSNSPESTNLKWQLREKDNQIMRLEAECAKLEQRSVEDSRNAAKITHENQETERAIAEEKQEKLRYLDEVHATNRKVDELQNKLKMVENRLAEKEAMIRNLQGPKVYGGNSFGSYNLPSDSYSLNAMGYNSQTSYDASNNSFDASNATASLLDPNNYGASSSSASISTAYSPGYGQTNPTYNQSAINLQTINYSPVKSSTGYNGSNYSKALYTQPSTTLDEIYDKYDPRRIDEDLKQLDEALRSKVSEMTLLNSSIQTNKLQLKQMNDTMLTRQLLKGRSSIDITVGNNSPSTSSSSASSSATKICANSFKPKKGLSSSCKNVSVEETFY